MPCWRGCRDRESAAATPHDRRPRLLRLQPDEESGKARGVMARPGRARRLRRGGEPRLGGGGPHRPPTCWPASGPPRQLAGARQAASGLHLTDRHRDVDLVVVAMGGPPSAASWWRPRPGSARAHSSSSVTHLPAGLGSDSGRSRFPLGDTIETVTAAPRPGRVAALAVIATGGALGRQAETGAVRGCYEQAGQPRAALGLVSRPAPGAS
jgi:hypothetical protein